MSDSIRTREAPEWQYEAFLRWFLPSEDEKEAVKIKRLAEMQAGER